ncbi:hypothetical protein T35B1_11832 [Salinisphaera shabanensis T35B1]|uniref:hypothetical protein n=1 Tax=Salinisphaera shabanensis TaxID=180542 RepID=UPI0033424197
MSDANAWQTPIALFVTLVVVLCTANFKQFLSFSADFWQAVFFISAVLTVIWFVVAILRRRKRMTANELIERMKRIN